MSIYVRLITNLFGLFSSRLAPVESDTALVGELLLVLLPVVLDVGLNGLTAHFLELVGPNGGVVAG